MGRIIRLSSIEKSKVVAKVIDHDGKYAVTDYTCPECSKGQAMIMDFNKHRKGDILKISKYIRAFCSNKDCELYPKHLGKRKHKKQGIIDKYLDNILGESKAHS